MQILPATDTHFDAFWPTFQQVAQAGDTYAYPADITKPQALIEWMRKPARTFVAVEEGKVLASYYIKTNHIKTNHAGPGAHVCNCGYMVAASARGQGLATALCEHSQQIAIEMGYEAMQFNFVASSNEGAVKLWQRLGFEIVGCLPGAFKHPQLSYVDAYVMYKWLQAAEAN